MMAQFPLATERCFELKEMKEFGPYSLCCVLSEKFRQRNFIKLGQAGWKQRMEKMLRCSEGGKMTVL